MNCFLSIHPSRFRYPWDPSFNIHMYEEQIKKFNQRELDGLGDTVKWLEEVDNIGSVTSCPSCIQTLTERNRSGRVDHQEGGESRHL